MVCALQSSHVPKLQLKPRGRYHEVTPPKGLLWTGKVRQPGRLQSDGEILKGKRSTHTTPGYFTTNHLVLFRGGGFQPSRLESLSVSPETGRKGKRKFIS